MVAFSTMADSKFLKQADLPEQGALCTIKSFKRVNVAQEGEDPENKFVMYVMEYEKPLVLNATNRAILEKIYGPDTADCEGNTVVMYVDPNVAYAGKIVGGIRLRAPRSKAKPTPPPKVNSDDIDNDIPF